MARLLNDQGHLPAPAPLLQWDSTEDTLVAHSEMSFLSLMLAPLEDWRCMLPPHMYTEYSAGKTGSGDVVHLCQVHIAVPHTSMNAYVDLFWYS